MYVCVYLHTYRQAISPRPKGPLCFWSMLRNSKFTRLGQPFNGPGTGSTQQLWSEIVSTIRFFSPRMFKCSPQKDGFGFRVGWKKGFNKLVTMKYHLIHLIFMHFSCAAFCLEGSNDLQPVVNPEVVPDEKGRNGIRVVCWFLGGFKLRG